MLFDTHCHLDAQEFDADREAVAAEAWQAGIGQIVVPAVAAANFGAVRACSESDHRCLPAYGIHPLYTASAREEDLETLRRWLSHEAAGATPPVAVGEIGLDFFVADAKREVQVFYFNEQLKIAAEAGLPVLLHVRRAVDAVLQQLRRVPVRGGIAHAFNGSREQADAFMSRGFCLGFGGAMTHSGSTRIRRLAASLPLAAIVLETDAPDMAPSWLKDVADEGRARRNTPSQLARIAQVLADLRGEPVERIIEVTTQNANRCLSLASI